MKRCTECGESKPFADFHKNSACKDGLHTKCKRCKLAKGAAWMARNGEHRKEYRRRTRVHRSEYAQRWYASNPEYRAQYYQENKEASYERRYRWIKANPEKHRALSQKRRAVLKFASDLGAIAEYMQLISADPCVYCGAPSQSTDHIAPLVHGGSPDWENLAPACRSCNSGKGAKDVLTFMLYRLDTTRIIHPVS